MQTKEYNFIDKTKWGEGEWLLEPDKVQWMDESTKLPCLAVRHPSGHWCGYVGVAEGHPYFGKYWGDCFSNDGEDYERDYLHVHGGLTYSDFCVEDEKEHGICHLVEHGQNDRVWWLGFDCAHSGDLTPKYGSHRGFSEREQYRTLQYVKSECSKLAKQLTNLCQQN